MKKKDKEFIDENKNKFAVYLLQASVLTWKGTLGLTNISLVLITASLRGWPLAYKVQLTYKHLPRTDHCLTEGTAIGLQSTANIQTSPAY